MGGIIWAGFRKLLFGVDAETAHRFVLALIRVGIALGGGSLRWVSGARPVRGRGSVLLARDPTESGAAAPPPKQWGKVTRVWGLEFSSPVGLAAGFDKDAEIVLGLPDLGFGFAEIGTVTPRPQAGNPRPRLFRDAATASLFNRMGFNGLGAELVASRLREAREKSHARFPSSFRVGVNIGKNKDTPNEEAVADFLAAARPFREIADYLVVNVSSPNTPGLRSLQSVQALRPIALGLKELVGGWRRTPPVLLKLAPEIRGEDLRVLLEAAESWGVDGFVLTNTLAGTWPAPGGELLGGWSGGALTAASRESLLSALRWTSRPVISVGGILSEDEAVSRLRAGASLVQLYSGWVFRGPGFPTRIRRAWESR